MLGEEEFAEAKGSKVLGARVVVAIPSNQIKDVMTTIDLKKDGEVEVMAVLKEDL